MEVRILERFMWIKFMPALMNNCKLKDMWRCA